MQVRDLRDQLLQPYPREVLYCEHCYQMTSAHKGDYWHLDPDYEFKCCNRPMKLVIERTVLEEVCRVDQ